MADTNHAHIYRLYVKYAPLREDELEAFGGGPVDAPSDGGSTRGPSVPAGRDGNASSVAIIEALPGLDLAGPIENAFWGLRCAAVKECAARQGL